MRADKKRPLSSRARGAARYNATPPGAYLTAKREGIKRLFTSPKEVLGEAVGAGMAEREEKARVKKDDGRQGGRHDATVPMIPNANMYGHPAEWAAASIPPAAPRSINYPPSSIPPGHHQTPIPNPSSGNRRVPTSTSTTGSGSRTPRAELPASDDGDEHVLPAGWLESKTINGRTYYYTLGGETRWEWPEGPATSSAGLSNGKGGRGSSSSIRKGRHVTLLMSPHVHFASTVAARMDGSGWDEEYGDRYSEGSSPSRTDSYSPETHAPRLTSPESLPARWVQADAPDGREYFYTLAGERKWKRPTYPASPIVEKPKFRPEKPSPRPEAWTPLAHLLPTGWYQAVAENGRLYFYTMAGVRTWTRPTQPASPAQETRSPRSEAHGTPTDLLPDGWYHAVAKNGRVYYYNVAGVRTWTLPTTAAEEIATSAANSTRWDDTPLQEQAIAPKEGYVELPATPMTPKPKDNGAHGPMTPMPIAPKLFGLGLVNSMPVASDLYISQPLDSRSVVSKQDVGSSRLSQAAALTPVLSQPATIKPVASSPVQDRPVILQCIDLQPVVLQSVVVEIPTTATKATVNALKPAPASPQLNIPSAPSATPSRTTTPPKPSAIKHFLAKEYSVPPTLKLRPKIYDPRSPTTAPVTPPPLNSRTPSNLDDEDNSLIQFHGPMTAYDAQFEMSGGAGPAGSLDRDERVKKVKVLTEIRGAYTIFMEMEDVVGEEQAQAGFKEVPAIVVSAPSTVSEVSEADAVETKDAVKVKKNERIEAEDQGVHAGSETPVNTSDAKKKQDVAESNATCDPDTNAASDGQEADDASRMITSDHDTEQPAPAARKQSVASLPESCRDLPVDKEGDVRGSDNEQSQRLPDDTKELTAVDESTKSEAQEQPTLDKEADGPSKQPEPVPASSQQLASPASNTNDMLMTRGSGGNGKKNKKNKNKKGAAAPPDQDAHGEEKSKQADPTLPSKQDAKKAAEPETESETPPISDVPMPTSGNGEKAVEKGMPDLPSNTHLDPTVAEYGENVQPVFPADAAPAHEPDVLPVGEVAAPSADGAARVSKAEKEADEQDDWSGFSVKAKKKKEKKGKNGAIDPAPPKPAEESQPSDVMETASEDKSGAAKSTLTPDEVEEIPAGDPAASVEDAQEPVRKEEEKKDDDHGWASFAPASKKKKGKKGKGNTTTIADPTTQAVTDVPKPDITASPPTATAAHADGDVSPQNGTPKAQLDHKSTPDNNAWSPWSTPWGATQATTKKHPPTNNETDAQVAQPDVTDLSKANNDVTQAIASAEDAEKVPDPALEARQVADEWAAWPTKKEKNKSKKGGKEDPEPVVSQEQATAESDSTPEAAADPVADKSSPDVNAPLTTEIKQDDGGWGGIAVKKEKKKGKKR